MWVMILTLLGTSLHTGPAVTVVPGFSTEATCMAAAHAWIGQLKGNLYTNRALALCVQQDQGK